MKTNTNSAVAASPYKQFTMTKAEIDAFNITAKLFQRLDLDRVDPVFRMDLKDMFCGCNKLNAKILKELQS